MDKRTTGIVATVAATLLCGLPGLCLCLFGALTAAGAMPYEYTLGSDSGTGTFPTVYGIVLLCVALILILIPVAVGYFTLRNKPETVTTTTYDEPIPPPT
jgi:hypothetical protein